MISRIMHPENFKTGHRVMMLKGRHKDGIEHCRTIVVPTSDIGQFNVAFNEFMNIARPGERIYATAGERDASRAIRTFKERQLQADYDDKPGRFYERINERWCSCLMAPNAEKKKLWLYDCDSKEDADFVLIELRANYTGKTVPYHYKTKNGEHILVSPFDKTKMHKYTEPMRHCNPIILWAY